MKVPIEVKAEKVFHQSQSMLVLRVKIGHQCILFLLSDWAGLRFSLQKRLKVTTIKKTLHQSARCLHKLDS